MRAPYSGLAWIVDQRLTLAMSVLTHSQHSLRVRVHLPDAKWLQIHHIPPRSCVYHMTVISKSWRELCEQNPPSQSAVSPCTYQPSGSALTFDRQRKQAAFLQDYRLER